MRIAPPRAGMRWGELFAARSGGEVPDGSRLPKRAERPAGLLDGGAMVERQSREERPEQERVEFLYPEYHLVVMRECCHPVSTVMARHRSEERRVGKSGKRSEATFAYTQ